MGAKANAGEDQGSGKDKGMNGVAVQSAERVVQKSSGNVKDEVVDEGVDLVKDEEEEDEVCVLSCLLCWIGLWFGRVILAIIVFCFWICESKNKSNKLQHAIGVSRKTFSTKSHAQKQKSRQKAHIYTKNP